MSTAAGGPAFLLPMLAKCDAVPNKICETCLFQESIPVIPFWNSKHPIPTRKTEVPESAARLTSSAFLHHAHPFVAAAEKNLFHAEKETIWSRSCGLQDLLQYSYRDCSPS